MGQNSAGDLEQIFSQNFIEFDITRDKSTANNFNVQV